MFEFAIIEFIGSNSVGIIPWSWLKINDLSKCHYPPDRQYKKSLNLSPQEKWKIFDCRVLSGAGNFQHITYI